MVSKIGLCSNLMIIDKIENDTTFEILQYNFSNHTQNEKTDKTEGNTNILKQIRIKLDDSAVRIRINSLFYIKGNVEKVNDEHEYKSLKDLLFSKRANNHREKYMFLLKGSGEILLNPSFKHFTLLELIDENIIIKKEAFCACDEEIEINSYNDNELILRGNGVVVLNLPVSENEIIRCKIFKDTIMANKEIAILRSNNITCKEENSDLVEEGKLNIYSGTGEVWLLPTKMVYNNFDSIPFNSIEDEE